MVEQMNAWQPDLIVDLGDRIDRDLKSYHDVEEVLSGLMAPVVFVPGNHDFSDDPRHRKLTIAKTGSPRGYHARVVGQWRLIFLNGLQNSQISHPKHSMAFRRASKQLKALKDAQAPHAYRWNGGLGTKQTRWVVKQLKIAALAQQSVMLFCHQPLSPGNPHSLWNNEVVLALLSQHTEPVFWINGHDHAGGYQQFGHVHLVTLHGMVEGDKPSYGLLEICQEEVRLVGVGNQLSYTFR